MTMKWRCWKMEVIIITVYDFFNIIYMEIMDRNCVRQIDIVRLKLFPSGNFTIYFFVSFFACNQSGFRDILLRYIENDGKKI